MVSVATLFLRGRLAFYIARSSYDDFLFVRQATFLERGQWLGPYYRLTLAKGPSYPAFVAAAYRIGVDLKVAEQLTMIAAAAMVALSVWLVTRRLWLTTAVPGCCATGGTPRCASCSRRRCSSRCTGL